MVGHDQHLRREALRPVAEEGALRPALGVPSEEYAAPAVARAQHDRRLVELAPSSGMGAARSGGEQLERQVAELDRSTRDGHHDRDPASPSDLPGAGHLGAVRPDGRHPDRTDGRALEHGGRSPRVVGVGVRDDEEVDSPLPLTNEPVGRPLVLTRVDEDPHRRCLEHQGVPLTDIDRRHRERRVCAVERGGERRSRSTARQEQGDDDTAGEHPASVHP